jgi:hypothetical protein
VSLPRVPLGRLPECRDGQPKPDGPETGTAAPESTDLAALAERCSRRPGLEGIGSGRLALALLDQLLGALPQGGGSLPKPGQEGAALDALAGIAPRDALEGMLAAQLVATHQTALECFRRAAIPEQSFEARQANLAQANRLVRSYAALVEALDRHRGKGRQVVRVEHVTVEAGGQAIVGAVTRERGGGG